MQTPRRQLTAAFALVLMAGAAIAAGCGSSPTSPNSPQPAAGAGNISGTVDTNHDRPHVAVITAAQVAAGAAIILDISNGLHSHTVNFTAAQVAQIKAGAQVSAASSVNPHSDGTGAHQHTVTFN
jgi:hypothetical protein